MRTSLAEAALQLQAATWSEFMLTGQPPRRCINGQALLAPAADLVEVSDGHIVLSAYTDTKWQAMCAALGLSDIAVDPRFADNPTRVANHGELLNRLGDALASL